MTSSGPGDHQPPAARNRIQIFVDFWNLQLSMNEKVGYGFRFDWERLPNFLMMEAARVGSLAGVSYEGTRVYASYDPARPGADAGFRNWLLGWLDRRPGVQVSLRERRSREAPRCGSCRRRIGACPDCGKVAWGSQEKGVDAAIVTDMVRLAWEDHFDVAVLVSSDSDFIPAVNFLDIRGKKVVLAAFPPAANQLAGPCWASFDLFASRDQFERR